VIRVRRILERGSAHPVFGPILLVVMVLLLAMVFLHVAGEGWDAATEIGAICLGIATVLGLVLLERMRDHFLEPVISVRGDRGPPRPSLTRLLRPIVNATGPGSLPLRR
jgi:hypothetical protein